MRLGMRLTGRRSPVAGSRFRASAYRPVVVDSRGRFHNSPRCRGRVGSIRSGVAVTIGIYLLARLPMLGRAKAR
jgi:hypothetical protein